MPPNSNDELSDVLPSYEEQLYKYTLDEGRHEPRFLIFRGLQLLSIYSMQNGLAKLKHDIMTSKSASTEQTKALKELLHDYSSQAQRGRIDLERTFGDEGYQFTDEGPGYRRLSDPHLIPSDKLRDFLKKLLPRSLSYTESDFLNRAEEYFSNKPPEQVSGFVDKLARFLVAFLGGAMLVVPMLIMRLPEITLVKSLVTVSISVLAFAGALSLFFDTKNAETMVATSTYAAVLVVFSDGCSIWQDKMPGRNTLNPYFPGEEGTVNGDIDESIQNRENFEFVYGSLRRMSSIMWQTQETPGRRVPEKL